jgi:cytochrome b
VGRRVWDAPVRIFHWLLALAFVAEWITQDDSRTLDIHVYAGYLIGVLVLFRLLWGVIGTRWARFDSFAYSPVEAIRYLRRLLQRRPEHSVGHNPAGTWAIYAILTLASVAVISGVAALAGEKGYGPMNGIVSYPQGSLAHRIHELVAWTMLAVVAAHIAGVVISSVVERQNLALAMITGVKPSSSEEASVSASVPAALLLIVLLLAGTAWYFRGYARATANRPYLPFARAALTPDPLWQQECGTCHLAFHPSLLPERSWTAMLADQHDHFGEDLGLSDSTRTALAAYAAMHSAEHAESPVAWKINAQIGPGESPLRITETRYWRRRHRSLPDNLWTDTRRSDCAACHRDAQGAGFTPGAIAIPSSTKTSQGNTK